MSAKDDLDHKRKQLRNLRKAIPETFAGFVALEQAASKDGALTKREKELVSLGMAIALRCEPCINSHVSALIRLDVTREEVAEIAGTAIQMAGGPGLMYAGKTLEVYDDLTD
ncbi:carboxymuconolactone decarboxylase family protein [Primorskyibacter sedentarius]|uniref:AhpD family alkylhydroperoxidase n=1 Tax=Primorskyibacter sedentarius TaxID=745311 RepID=A0A4V2UMT6_9RHOB|nr:carboxymuconolactone decarboxylase family protein [Primorskyibacter sedentarius]TCS58467.1 AhpD family alkylhydroperoxidase [Primorskyibacter sedentarius]